MNGHTARLAVQFVLLAGYLTPFGCPAADQRLLRTLNESAEIGHLTQVRSIPPSVSVVAGVKIFQVDLKWLQSKFGSAPITRLSAREGSPVALCYLANDVALVFRAGAMGGWKRVTGFTAAPPSSLEVIGLDCVRSAKLATWISKPENGLLNRNRLSRKLGLDSLPPDGILATKRWIVGGEERVQSSVIVYSQDLTLNWVDISHFVER